jgi:integrase
MKYLTIDEMTRLLAAVDTPRHKLMLKVAFLHGLRVSELIGLTTKNIQDGYLTVKRLKGSQKTTQPLQCDGIGLFNENVELSDLVLTLKPGDRLFPMTRWGVYKLMKRAGKRAGIPEHKLFPHALKHSIAMQTIHSAGIENVRQWLGHKSIASTGAYLRVSDDEAAKAIGTALHVAGEVRQ